MKNLVCMGVITTAHGIKGEVKIKAYTEDPRNIMNYGPLADKNGKVYTLTITGEQTDNLIATIEGVTSRNDAEAIRGTELFVKREQLPPAKEGEYYHEDLKGLEAVLENGDVLGTVTDVYNFGAGDIIGITHQNGEEILYSFDHDTVKNIDTEKRQLVICPPDFGNE